MAKKTRPRRPVKKVRKAAPKRKRQTKAQKAAQREAELHASLRKSDPFYLDPKLVPVGWAYQWTPVGTDGVRIFEHQLKPGWTPVPFSRHAHDFPSSYQDKFSRIVYRGLMLVEATAERAAAELGDLRQQAVQLEKDICDSLGIPGMKISYRQGFPMLPDEQIETKVLDDAPPEVGPPIETPISLLIRVPARWATAAAYLNLTLTEYARRRVVGERLVLGSLDLMDGSLEAVYEPVNLKFSPQKVD